MAHIRFNRGAAFFGAATAFFSAEAYAFGFAKTCDSHFNLPLMFGWLFISNFFMWIWWIPLALICGVGFGLLILSDTEKTYRALAWSLATIPIVTLAATFLVIPYGSEGRCVI
jgi:hypothetical protein